MAWLQNLMAHSRDLYSVVSMYRGYSSLSYCSVYFLISRGVGQRDQLWKSVTYCKACYIECGLRATSPLQHIFWKRAVRLQRSRFFAQNQPNPPTPFHFLMPDPCTSGICIILGMPAAVAWLFVLREALNISRIEKSTGVKPRPHQDLFHTCHLPRYFVSQGIPGSHRLPVSKSALKYFLFLIFMWHFHRQSPSR